MTGYHERTAGELVSAQNRDGAHHALRLAFAAKRDAEAGIAILCKFLKIELVAVDGKVRP